MSGCSILFISPGPTYRPKSEAFQREYINLSEAGHSGYVFSTSSVNEAMQIGRFSYLAMKSNESIWSTIRYFYYCAREARKLKTKVDLVVTYDPLKTGLIGLIVSRILGAKLVVEVNGVYTSPAEWLDGGHKLSSKIKKALYPKIMKFVLKRADAIKLLYRSQIESLESDLKGKLIRAFPCYVATDGFKDIESRKEILFAGFPFKRKGVDVLIEAFKLVSGKHDGWALKILGWFPDMSELDGAINGHPQIYHHKPVHMHEMPDHIGRCSIFALPSRSEGMGRVLVEAMAAGKARVGSNVDGIPYVIEDGIDGVLVEPDNALDLANKLDLLMGDEAERRRLSDNGLERLKKEFTADVYSRNVNDFYEEVLRN
ncbi:MAG: hypothetical protein COB71_02615 [Thiotrichales bacterium]|nr:MAG: hypothetical protein COB71_02615 [Thiotrichales bacterium]